MEWKIKNKDGGLATGKLIAHHQWLTGWKTASIVAKTFAVLDERAFNFENQNLDIT